MLWVQSELSSVSYQVSEVMHNMENSHKTKQKEPAYAEQMA